MRENGLSTIKSGSLGFKKWGRPLHQNYKHVKTLQALVAESKITATKAAPGPAKVLQEEVH